MVNEGCLFWHFIGFSGHQLYRDMKNSPTSDPRKCFRKTHERNSLRSCYVVKVKSELGIELTHEPRSVRIPVSCFLYATGGWLCVTLRYDLRQKGMDVTFRG